MAAIELHGEGTWGQRTRENRREDYCTKMTTVPARKGPCPRWRKFLERIMCDDNDMIDYLQRCAGYWLTPYINEQVFWFFYGGGQNGKGAYLRTIQRILGTSQTGYAHTAGLDLFLASKFERHPEELARLRAKRLVIATELSKGKSWDEAKIKMLTGGDRIRARFMRQNSFEFDPQFKIVVSGNDKPKIQSVDPAMMRRLQLVPFDAEITDAERSDRDFEERLYREEGAMILGWMLDGLDEWRKHRLSPPEKVIAASQEYFVEQDTLAQWIEERCETGNRSFFAFSTALYQDWKTWCEARGFRYGSQTSFSSDLKKKHFDGPHHGMKGNGFYGIRLKPREDQDF